MTEQSSDNFTENKSRPEGSSSDIFPAYLFSIGKIKRFSEEESRSKFFQIRNLESRFLKELCRSKKFISFLMIWTEKACSGQADLSEISSNSFGYHPSGETEDSYQKLVVETIEYCQKIHDACVSASDMTRILSGTQDEIYSLVVKLNLNLKLAFQFVENSGSSELKNRLAEIKNLREQFLNANLRLVISVAKRYKNHHLTMLDLVQEGNIGLIKAMEKFDPHKGFLFSTYAIWWIKQSMNRALENQSNTIRLPAHVFQKNSRLYKFSSQAGKDISDDELAKKIGVSKHSLGRIKEASRLKISSLDEPAKDCEDLNLGDIISSDFEDPAEIISQDELREKLSELISRLNDQQKKVLSMRFGLEGEDPLSLRDIGKKLGVSGERVRQIQNRAISHLRHPARADKLRAFYSN